ncbi:P-loop containing nucleoside triphosphate hydrolase protein [Acrodontium crateriforme]|uniref:ATP-dependent RNA helicase n=1 Tax=Acrodontium crateriforme TaxID=150365 RepID=A0AAQ3R848_9PEZI|nr:P-loop containing nucleoside triphosphate hydrolase protein [Acrodontium crateriforme]
MDPLKLLSRSTKRSRPLSAIPSSSTLSNGQNGTPQSFNIKPKVGSKKRKRGPNDGSAADGADDLNFFGDSGSKPSSSKRKIESDQAKGLAEDDADQEDTGTLNGTQELSEEERRSILKKHKLKIIWLNQPTPATTEKRKGKENIKVKKIEKPSVFPQPVQSFGELRERYNISNRLAENIHEQGYSVPTEVQLGSLPLLLQEPAKYLPGELCGDSSHVDLLTVAPTGSGKTLAFMIPLVRNIQAIRRAKSTSTKSTSAIILAPTKELVGQIVNEGRKLAKGTGVQITQVRKGMRLSEADSEVQDSDVDEGTSGPVSTVKSDILVSTPGLLQSIMENERAAENEHLVDVKFLVLDEADVLLDPLFRDQTLSIWNGLSNQELRVSLWSATMGSNIEELARSTINDRRVNLESKGSPVEAPLIRLVVGLKDSAVPNVQHKLIYAATEQGKLMGLRQLLHPTTSTAEAGPPLRPPFLVFTQTIERAVALHSELLYDIPAEAGGINRIAVLHSDLSDSARDLVMTRFRKGEIWVLITTDLLSRGVDFRGVNGVVNYDIPTSSAAYVHRVGRAGRAGRDGVAITLYSQEDVPYLKHVANVVSMAEKQNGSTDGSGMQQWLLDALPTLTKQDKQKFKKHGLESRTSRGKEKNPKASRKARISTKSGFARKSENNRKGAIQGSQRRAQAEAENGGEETDFGGFEQD